MRFYHKISLIIAWIDKIFALIWRFAVSKKKGFWCFGNILNIERGIKIRFCLFVARFIFKMSGFVK